MSVKHYVAIDYSPTNICKSRLFKAQSKTCKPFVWA